MNDLIDSLSVAESTKQNYKYMYIALIRAGISPSLPEEVIINKLKEKSTEFKYNKISDFLTIVIVIRKAKGNPYGKIKKYRDERRHENQYRETDTNKDNRERGLPTFKDIKMYTAKLYADENYKDYIINFLLIATNSRNKDLDLTIVRKEPMDMENNYLVIYKNYIRYIRNDYKTKKYKGSKEFKISSKPFIDSVNKLIGSEDSKKLLETVGKNSEIKNATYQKLGQGRYFKIIVSEKAKDDLTKIANNRGTNVKTLLDFYNISKDSQ